MAGTLNEFSSDTERRRQELLELISSLSGSIDIASSVGLICGLRACGLIWLGRLEGVL
jgi:hypothetical protein